MAVVKVGIVVPKRPQFGDAYWAIQRKFDSGLTVVELDDATEEGQRQLAELRADPVLTLLEGDAVVAQQAADEVLAKAAAEAEAVKSKAAEASPGKPMKRS